MFGLFSHSLKVFVGFAKHPEKFRAIKRIPNSVAP